MAGGSTEGQKEERMKLHHIIADIIGAAIIFAVPVVVLFLGTL